MTLHHDMNVKTALETVRRYNGMTEAVICQETYFVRSAVKGRALLPKPEIRISDDLFLYALKDGHVRLVVKQNGQKRGTV